MDRYIQTEWMLTRDEIIAVEKQARKQYRYWHPTLGDYDDAVYYIHASILHAQITRLAEFLGPGAPNQIRWEMLREQVRQHKTMSE